MISLAQQAHTQTLIYYGGDSLEQSINFVQLQKDKVYFFHAKQTLYLVVTVMQPRIPFITEPIYQFEMQRILGNPNEESLMRERDVFLENEIEQENLSNQDEDQSEKKENRRITNLVLIKTSVILIGLTLGCITCLLIALFCRFLLVGSVHVEAMTQAPYEKPEDPEIQVAQVRGQTGGEAAE